jgi:hypothetical protein
VIYERTCLGCGVQFCAFVAKTIFCTKRCGYLSRRENPPLAGGQQTCVLCGKNFIAMRHAYFCGFTCRTRQYRILALIQLGGKCAKCGYTEDWRALHIDHIYGGGNKERKANGRGLSFYRRVISDKKGLYQALCANCHYIKTLDYCTINLKSCKSHLMSNASRLASTLGIKADYPELSD